VPDFFVFVLFFVAFESLLDGSPVCCADCDQAATPPTINSKDPSRIRLTILRFLVFKLLLQPRRVPHPARHTLKQLVERDADGFQECVARIPSWNGRMMPKNTREVKNEGDRLPGWGRLSAGETERLNRPRQRFEPLRRIRRVLGAWDRAQMPELAARVPEKRWLLFVGTRCGDPTSSPRP
jgi:hypothetical protein